MATPLLGTGYGLWIDFTTPLTAERGTEEDYVLVSCSTETGLDITVDETDTSNKCDEGNASSVPGLLNWNINWNGQAATLSTAEQANQVNYQKLVELITEKQLFFSKIIATNDPNYIREGKTFITNINETQPNQAVFPVTATIKGVGKLFITPATP